MDNTVMSTMLKEIEEVRNSVSRSGVSTKTLAPVPPLFLSVFMDIALQLTQLNKNVEKVADELKTINSFGVAVIGENK